MTHPSNAYRDAEARMAVPPVAERGRHNGNPPGIGFWALVAEDFRTHERKIFEQGFWAIFVHRFGNWRMGQPKLIRAPATLVYRVLFKFVEWFCGISLWYTVKLGRRVRIWHHSGMILGARAIGDECHIRQNVTLGVAQTGRNADLPIIGPRVDIGAGACIAGSVYVGEGAKIGANALVITDIPDGATAMGNPAGLIGAAPEPSDSVGGGMKRAGDLASHATEAVTLTPRNLGHIALLGSANLDTLAATLSSVALRWGMEVTTLVPPFGQTRMELLKPRGTSELEAAMVQGLAATLIFERADDILGPVAADPLSLAPDNIEAFVAEALAPLIQTIRSARDRLPGPILVASLGVFSPAALGQADTRTDRGVSALVAKANAMLEAETAKLADVHMISTADLLTEVGRRAADPGSYWHLGRVPFSEAFAERLSLKALGAVLSLRGLTSRILFLDLDNTLWGGVLGEDGIEGIEIGGAYPGSAYRDFQEALAALAARGIALAVASKNDEDLALSAIAGHPEMVLRPDDIVAHRIGWTEKATGISDMLDEIGLGQASAMFIDDNPVEREKVRVNLPEVIVPPFPAAPEALAAWILENPWLDCLDLTDSDLKRSRQYKSQAKVTAARRDFTDIEEFYRDLGMTLTFEPLGPSNQKRVLQLFAKTNQFNATLRRHDAAALARLTEAGGEVFAIGVADRFSPYELMGVIVLAPDSAMKAAYPDDEAIQSTAVEDAWWVDSFLLSCRILGRTVEQAIVAWATDRAVGKGAKALLGEVIEAPRNAPVRGVYSKAGLEQVETGLDLGAGGVWIRDLSEGPIALSDWFQLTEIPLLEPAVRGTKAPKKAAHQPDSGSGGVSAKKRSGTLDPMREARLADTFRRFFRLDGAVDLSAASMDSLEAWDSLAHLRLAMEIDRSLGIRIPGDRLGQVTSYSDLRAVVAEIG